MGLRCPNVGICISSCFSWQYAMKSWLCRVKGQISNTGCLKSFKKCQFLRSDTQKMSPVQHPINAISCQLLLISTKQTFRKRFNVTLSEIWTLKKIKPQCYEGWPIFGNPMPKLGSEPNFGQKLIMAITEKFVAGFASSPGFMMFSCTVKCTNFLE